MPHASCPATLAAVTVRRRSSFEHLSAIVKAFAVHPSRGAAQRTPADHRCGHGGRRGGAGNGRSPHGQGRGLLGTALRPPYAPAMGSPARPEKARLIGSLLDKTTWHTFFGSLRNLVWAAGCQAYRGLVRNTQSPVPQTKGTFPLRQLLRRLILLNLSVFSPTCSSSLLSTISSYYN